MELVKNNDKIYGKIELKTMFLYIEMGEEELKRYECGLNSFLVFENTDPLTPIYFFVDEENYLSCYISMINPYLYSFSKSLEKREINTIKTVDLELEKEHNLVLKIDDTLLGIQCLPQDSDSDNVEYGFYYKISQDYFTITINNNKMRLFYEIHNSPIEIIFYNPMYAAYFISQLNKVIFEKTEDLEEVIDNMFEKVWDYHDEI